MVYTTMIRAPHNHHDPTVGCTVDHQSRLKNLSSSWENDDFSGVRAPNVSKTRGKCQKVKEHKILHGKMPGLAS